MIRYSSCQGGRGLISRRTNYLFAKKNACDICFADMIFVSLTVAGDNGRPLSE